MTATIAPGKSRMIGAYVPGSERWAPLMDRYQLSGLAPGWTPERYLEQVLPLGSPEAYQRWLDAYRRNDGTFLGTLAWGHDRYLGRHEGREIWLHGAMDDRHISNLERLVSAGWLDPARDVAGKDCLGVGCWTGEELLLLHAHGARTVDGCEEVAEYARLARVQLAAFGVPGVVQECGSLYAWPGPLLVPQYDLIYCPGVMYHLTDPIAALAICWALLRPGGLLAFESIADPPFGQQGSALLARYLGASVPGWNWWSPGKDTYEAMMRDCGFPDAECVEFARGRGWWVGRKSPALPLLATGAAGFSRPDLLPILRRLAG